MLILSHQSLGVKRMKKQMFRNLSYKEAKQRVKNWLIEVRAIEIKLAGRLTFENDYLNIERIMKSDNAADDSVQNSGYEHGVNESCFEKAEMLVILQLFVSIFNEFDNDSRVIIYHSFFRNRLNESIAQKLNFSISKLGRLKSKAIIGLAESLELELLAYYFGVA